MLEALLRAVIPLFVAVDPFGLLPIYLGISAEQPQRHRTLPLVLAVATALAVSFFAAGPAVLRFLSIRPADFRIAGGLLLVLIAIREIFAPKASAAGRSADDGPGHASPEPPLVPLATPLIVGPAVLTTGLALTPAVGLGITSAAFLLVMLATAGVLYGGSWLTRHVRAGIWAMLSKIVCILLAAIGVAFVREGLAEWTASGVFGGH